MSIFPSSYVYHLWRKKPFLHFLVHHFIFFSLPVLNLAFLIIMFILLCLKMCKLYVFTYILLTVKNIATVVMFVLQMVYIFFYVERTKLTLNEKDEVLLLFCCCLEALNCLLGILPWKSQVLFSPWKKQKRHLWQSCFFVANHCFWSYFQDFMLVTQFWTVNIGSKCLNCYSDYIFQYYEA